MVTLHLFFAISPRMSTSRFRFHDYENRKVISLLGIKIPYPVRFIELLGLVCVLALVGFFFLRVTDRAFLESASKRVFEMLEVAPDGSVQKVSGYVRYGFWTPGANTSQQGEVSGTNVATVQGVDAEKSGVKLEDWESGVTEDRLNQFGEELREKLGANGYRRYEVTGYGRTKQKKGYWWIVTLPESVKPDQLGRLYQDFFHTGKPVYFETMGSTL